MDVDESSIQLKLMPCAEDEEECRLIRPRANSLLTDSTTGSNRENKDTVSNKHMEDTEAV